MNTTSELSGLDEVATLPVEAQPLALAEALAQIEQDSRQEPQRYLDETVVPHGGE